jgi:Major royal jelly protein
MRVTDNDPGSLWILSSRFQRFFLKNLKPEEVNTRILRIRGVVERRHQPVVIQPQRGGYASFYYNAPAPPQHYDPDTALYPAYEHHEVTQRPIIKPVSYSTYVGPYDYENVALVNKFVNNPFVQLNMGEKPLLGQLRPQYGGLTGEVYYPKPQINFDDFNGLRVAKSVKNLSTTHH